MAFLGASEEDRFEELFERAAKAGALTVGDVDGFVERGGMIELDTVGQRIGLRVNPEAVEGAGLQISSHLLKLARIVRPSGTE